MAMNTKMKSAIALSSLTAALLTFSGCGSDDETAAIISQTACQLAGVDTILSGAQSADVTVAADGVIGINGEVSFASGTIFTLGEGATVVGCTGASYVAMDRGSKIEAVGTEAKPVVMTSLEGFNGLNTGDEQGQWGGLSIFGSATTNKGIETYEAGDHQFGCDDTTITCNDADNSGTLQYVTIRYSGYEVETDKELKGLSLGGVGSGTTIDHVAVIGSLDDGVEVWGGKVAMTNLYLYNNADDSLDWDHGWTGSATNVYVEQKEVDGTGSRGFETDNNGGSTTKEVAMPISNPTITNFTIVTAAAGGQGIVNREGTAGNLSNGIIITNNAGKANVEVRSATTITNGLVYSGDMVLAQSAGIHYAGKTENTADSIFGDTTAAEVESLFTGTVVETTETSLTLVKLANDTVCTDVTAMPAWTK